jgi:hypothetical protein
LGGASPHCAHRRELGHAGTCAATGRSPMNSDATELLAAASLLVGLRDIDSESWR